MEIVLRRLSKLCHVSRYELLAQVVFRDKPTVQRKNIEICLSIRRQIEHERSSTERQFREDLLK